MSVDRWGHVPGCLSRGLGRWMLAVGLVMVAWVAAAWGQVPGEPVGEEGMFAQLTDLPIWYWLAPIGGVVALVMAGRFYDKLMKHTEGDESMIRIAEAVREGAKAYLRQQYSIVAGVFVVLILLIVALVLAGLQSELTGFGVALGGLFSGLCGFIGMRTATNASARTAAAARESLNEGLKVAFRAGAVMGLCVTGFALLDVSFWLFILRGLFEDTPTGLVAMTSAMLSFALGASLQALFARVGGGIYTKAADVGADLVGKVEAGIAEDDVRNPATIADNVGDNVGDVAGMGADLYESYYGSILAAMALGAAAALRLDLSTAETMSLIVLPPALAGLGVMASALSIFLVRTQDNADMKALNKSLHFGVHVSSVLILVAGLGLIWALLGNVEAVSYWGIWGAIVVGLVTGLVIAQGSEYFTSFEHRPTKFIAEQAQTGSATVIIAGFAQGMKSTWIPLVSVAVAIILAFNLAGGTDQLLMGVFGVAIAAVGMLSTLGITLATDAYGPIADNAGGNAEMTHQDPQVRQRTDLLDALGNTTAATGKGFAIGSAALTGLALLAAYTITVQASLTNLAGNYVVPEGRQATYLEGHRGLFAMPPLEDQVRTDAGLLIAGASRQKIVRALEQDAKPTWSPRPDSQGDLVGELEIQGYPHRFELIRASTADLPTLLSYYDVTLLNPRVLCGLLLGVMLVFVFCALTMNAVGRAAYAMMREARRQFALMRQALKAQGMTDEQVADMDNWPDHIEHENHRYPDYATCVGISTRGALNEMVAPTLLAVATPIVVGLVLGVAGVMGLLAGTLVCGFGVAIFMANAGGAWDNAKKSVESYGKTTAGEYRRDASVRERFPENLRSGMDALAEQLADDELIYGSGSPDHKATVVGDTVGDPFKDTSGPALNILIKLVSIVSVVFAGAVVAAGGLI